MLSIVKLKSKNVIIDKLELSSNLNLSTYSPENFNSGNKIILRGVQSISLKIDNTLGNTQGIAVNFLQPWYNKPTTIEIKGLSYQGSLSQGSFAEWAFFGSPDVCPGQDQTVEDIYTHIVQPNFPYTSEQDYKKYFHIVSLENHFQEKSWIKFIGFITSVHYTEKIEQAFIYDYDISFTGLDFATFLTVKSQQDGLNDLWGIRGAYLRLKSAIGDLIFNKK